MVNNLHGTAFHAAVKGTGHAVGAEFTGRLLSVPDGGGACVAFSDIFHSMADDIESSLVDVFHFIRRYDCDGIGGGGS